MKTIYLFILLTLISFSAFAQKSADLTYNLELNKTYRVKNISVQSTTQTVMSNEQSTQINTTSVFSLKPLKKMDGEMMVEVKFDTLHSVISQPAMDINSANPGDINSTDPAKVMECIMNRMANSTFLVKMANTGQVIEFINLQTTVAGILQGVDSIQGKAAPFIKQRIEMLVQEKSLKTMIESVTAYLPGNEIKIGGKWDITLNVYGGGMGMTQKGNYKLESLDKKTANISANMVIESKPDVMEMNGAQIKPDIRGLGKTKLTIDKETGWIIKGEVKQQLKGEMAVNAQGNSMTIPIEINIDSEVMVIK